MVATVKMMIAVSGQNATITPRTVRPAAYQRRSANGTGGAATGVPAWRTTRAAGNEGSIP